MDLFVWFYGLAFEDNLPFAIIVYNKEIFRELFTTSTQQNLIRLGANHKILEKGKDVKMMW